MNRIDLQIACLQVLRREAFTLSGGQKRDDVGPAATQAIDFGSFRREVLNGLHEDPVCSKARQLCWTRC